MSSEKAKPLPWNSDPILLLGMLTLVIAISTFLFYYYSANNAPYVYGVVATVILGLITALLRSEQCPHCKRILCLTKISDEIVKNWEENKQYKEKTIYFYSDGETQKDVRYGAQKAFTAKYERHKYGYHCNKCGETHYKTKDIFVNKEDWERVTTPNKITTTKKKPQEHHTNLDNLSIDSFNPTYYQSKSGIRKTIPKKVKMDLWNKHFGRSNGYGKCLVCGNKIHMSTFEAGHYISAKNNGGDKISNLRPICSACNKSMGSMNFDDYKKKYYS